MAIDRTRAAPSAKSAAFSYIYVLLLSAGEIRTSWDYPDIGRQTRRIVCKIARNLEIFFGN